MSAVEYDPFDVAQEIPVDIHRELRQACPVARIPVGWFLTRHADVRDAVRDVESFRTSYREPGVVVPAEEELLPEMPEPRHGKVRRIVNAVVGWHKAVRMEAFIRQLSHEYLDPILASGRGEFVAEFAAPIPINVMAEMIGVPRQDWPLFRIWSDEVVQGEYVNKNRTERGEGFGGGHPEFASYVDALIADRHRRSDRPDDVVTRLIETEINGHRLTDVEIRTQLISLILGGNETTRHLIANLLARVACDPALFETLKREPDRVGEAVEECLRLDPPIHQMLRTIEVPVERFGPSMCPGEKIIYGVSSANRDDSVFDDPDTFRLDRANAKAHLSFGDGPHVCPGQAIARLEGRVTLEVFLERVAAVEPDAGWVHHKVPVFWANGPIDLPLRVTPVT
jgi:cytochrome P450 family 109